MRIVREGKSARDAIRMECKCECIFVAAKHREAAYVYDKSKGVSNWVCTCPWCGKQVKQLIKVRQERTNDSMFRDED